MSPDAILPKYKSLGDAGADIYTLEDVVIEPGRTELVRTGIKAVVPGGYKLEIVPRSGISATTKVRVPNTPGTIDCEYRDEIKVIVENCGDEPVHFSKSSRIAQMILVPIVKIDWEEVSESEFSKYSTNRGKGFGSSGLK